MRSGPLPRKRGARAKTQKRSARTEVKYSPAALDETAATALGLGAVTPPHPSRLSADHSGRTAAGPFFVDGSQAVAGRPREHQLALLEKAA